MDIGRRSLKGKGDLVGLSDLNGFPSSEENTFRSRGATFDRESKNETGAVDGTANDLLVDLVVRCLAAGSALQLRDNRLNLAGQRIAGATAGSQSGLQLADQSVGAGGVSGGQGVLRSQQGLKDLVEKSLDVS